MTTVTGNAAGTAKAIATNTAKASAADMDTVTTRKNR
jgi:hypothetical protein